MSADSACRLKLGSSSATLDGAVPADPGTCGRDGDLISRPTVNTLLCFHPTPSSLLFSSTCCLVSLVFFSQLFVWLWKTYLGGMAHCLVAVVWMPALGHTHGSRYDARLGWIGFGSRGNRRPVFCCRTIADIDRIRSDGVLDS